MAAAIGAGLPVSEPTGSMVVDIGGGTTRSRRAVAGRHRLFPQRARRRRQDGRSHHRLYPPPPESADRRSLVGAHQEGNRSAALPMDGNGVTMEIKGRDLLNGVPKEITITQRHIAEALAEPVGAIVEAVKVALEATPPELAADIVDKGIVLTGGGSLLANLDQVLRDETGLPVSIADDPLSLRRAGHRPGAGKHQGHAPRPFDGVLKRGGARSHGQRLEDRPQEQCPALRWSLSSRSRSSWWLLGKAQSGLFDQAACASPTGWRRCWKRSAPPYRASTAGWARSARSSRSMSRI